MSGDSPWILFAAEIPLAHFASHCAKTGVKNVLQVRFEGYENVDARRVLEENGMALYVENMGGYMRVKTGKDLSVSDGVTPAVRTDVPAGQVRIFIPAEGSSGFYKAIRNYRRPAVFRFASAVLCCRKQSSGMAATCASYSSARISLSAL